MSKDNKIAAIQRRKAFIAILSLYVGFVLARMAWYFSVQRGLVLQDDVWILYGLIPSLEFAVAAICLQIRALWSLRHEMQRGARVAEVMSAIAVAAILAWVIAVLVSGL